jgi:outer membrane beta-barrel protein
VELNFSVKSGQGGLLELCHLLLSIRLRRQTFGNLKTWLVAIALGAFLQAAPALAQAQERIRFPEEELATESVLPVFDQPVSVKSRNVELASRLELGVQGGYAMTEPFFNPLSFGVSLAYHFNEEWGAQLMYNTQMQGLSSEASQLNPIPNTNPPVNANLQYAPAPKAIAIANVQYSAYYGKISLSKEMVMNLHLFGLAGAGMITLGDVQKPLLSVGLGQKFYFSENMSFRFDLRLLAYQGPDPTSIRLDNKFEPQPSSAFSNRVFIEGFLTAGLSYALPSF